MLPHECVSSHPDLVTLRAALAAPGITYDDCCNPTKEVALPFPSGNPRPGRFAVRDDGTFLFAGREKLRELHDAVGKLGVGGMLLFYGTVGYGKSHIQAAEVVLRLREKKAVVFLPDCAAMLRDPLEYAKKALELVLPDEHKAAALACTTPEALVEWVKHTVEVGTLYFFVGQFNALEAKKVASFTAEEQTACRTFIRSVSSQHMLIMESSASNAQAQTDLSSQSKPVMCYAYGGLTEVHSPRALASLLLPFPISPSRFPVASRLSPLASRFSSPLASRLSFHL